MEIQVELPDVMSASDLESHLAARDEQAALVSAEGVHRVVVQANGKFPALLTSIREWVGLRGMGTVRLEMNGSRYTIAAD